LKDSASGYVFIDDGRTHAWSVLTQYKFRQFFYFYNSTSKTITIKNLQGQPSELLNSLSSSSSNSSSSNLNWKDEILPISSQDIDDMRSFFFFVYVYFFFVYLLR
jgi:hypothetical protein